MDPEGPAIKSWLAKQALGCALEISFIPGCDLGTKYMDAVATKKGESWEVKVIEGVAVEEFPSEAHEEDFHSLFGATGKGFWAELSLEDSTAALREGGGATGGTAAEVSANNPATMLLSLGQFWASCSMLRALQGARRLLKLVYQFFIVFFALTGGCR